MSINQNCKRFFLIFVLLIYNWARYEDDTHDFLFWTCKFKIRNTGISSLYLDFFYIFIYRFFIILAWLCRCKNKISGCKFNFFNSVLQGLTL